MLRRPAARRRGVTRPRRAEGQTAASRPPRLPAGGLRASRPHEEKLGGQRTSGGYGGGIQEVYEGQLPRKKYMGEWRCDSTAIRMMRPRFHARVTEKIPRNRRKRVT